MVTEADVCLCVNQACVEKGGWVGNQHIYMCVFVVCVCLAVCMCVFGVSRVRCVLLKD